MNNETTLKTLEQAAGEIAAETGITLEQARTAIRLALGELSLRRGLPVEQVNAYFDACGLPVEFVRR